MPGNDNKPTSAKPSRGTRASTAAATATLPSAQQKKSHAVSPDKDGEMKVDGPPAINRKSDNEVSASPNEKEKAAAKNGTAKQSIKISAAAHVNSASANVVVLSDEEEIPGLKPKRKSTGTPESAAKKAKSQSDCFGSCPEFHFVEGSDNEARGVAMIFKDDAEQQKAEGPWASHACAQHLKKQGDKAFGNNITFFCKSDTDTWFREFVNDKKKTFVAKDGREVSSRVFVMFLGEEFDPSKHLKMLARNVVKCLEQFIEEEFGHTKSVGLPDNESAHLFNDGQVWSDFIGATGALRLLQLVHPDTVLVNDDNINEWGIKNEDILHAHWKQGTVTWSIAKRVGAPINCVVQEELEKLKKIDSQTTVSCFRFWKSWHFDVIPKDFLRCQLTCIVITGKLVSN